MTRFIRHLGVERPHAMYEYYVTGSGVFPFDMLRHDCCWPVSGEDARSIMEGQKIRSIHMHSWREPTIDRWSSFVWSVGTEKL